MNTRGFSALPHPSHHVLNKRPSLRQPSLTPLSLAHPAVFQVSTKIQRKLDCNLLVLTSSHLVLCLERKFQLYTLEAELVREWQLDATIRYIKVLGGSPGRDGLLVGLKSGDVLKIFVDNPFPIHVLTHGAPIRRAAAAAAGGSGPAGCSPGLSG